MVIDVKETLGIILVSSFAEEVIKRWNSVFFLTNLWHVTQNSEENKEKINCKNFCNDAYNSGGLNRLGLGGRFFS